MDEVLEQLGAAVIGESDADKNKNEYESLYKNQGRVGSQEERRINIMKAQKSHRNDKLDTFRGILELVREVEDDHVFRQTKAKTYYRPSIYVAGFTKVPNYADVLTQSEWLYEKPSDFAENWLAVPCPKATRMMVLAIRGTTKCFNKYGNFRFECRTALPGGNPCDNKAKTSNVVLDCYYYEPQKTMYVLDVLAWNEQVMTDGETEFRHYWINSYLQEIPGLTTLSKKNTLIFKVIPKIPCDPESLRKFLTTFPFYPHNQPPVDGLLFYHKKAHYFSGETPMVNWLFPYMVPEVLGQDIQVHKGYMLERPEDYTNHLAFIEKFEKKSSRIRQRKMFGSKNMDTSNISEADVDKAEPSNENGNGIAPQMDTLPSSSHRDEKNSAGSAEMVETEQMEETVNDNKVHKTITKTDDMKTETTFSLFSQ